jgi:hypothetical protein
VVVSEDQVDGDELEEPEDVRFVSGYEIQLEEHRRWVKRTRKSFLALGVVVGATAGVVAYAATSSVPFAAFTFGVAGFVVGRGVGQVITAEGKVQRALYFAIAPLVGIVAGAVARVVWGRWWLAAIAGSAMALMGRWVSSRVFRRVAWRVRREGIDLGFVPD